MNHYYFPLGVFVLVVILAFPVNADIVIDNFSDETNDRFTNSSQFIGAGFDFSGVGRSNRWGTLISENVIISANHFRPSGEIHFYEDNDPNGSPVVRTVASGQRIGNSDIYVALLDAPVTSNINVYDFVSESLAAPAFDEETNSVLHDAGSFQDEVVFTVGLSATDHGDRRIEQAVGRNRISGYVEDLPFQSNTNNDSLIFNYDTPVDSDYVEFESQFRGGDSGGPLFVERNGELVLLGVNSFINAPESETLFSGVTFIGNHTEEINAFISANAVAAVPEPGTLILLTFGLACTSLGRRRRA